jgi:hypothetical protein
LILDVRIEILVHGPLELIEVIDVLNNPVDSILESFNKDVVMSDLGLVLLDELTHVLLSGSEIINNVTQIGINFVVVFQVSIHVIRLFLEFGNLKTSWSNISLELFDLVVQDEFELLKLLGLLFQRINFLFEFTNSLILVQNLNTLGLDGKSEFVSGFSLKLML